MAGDVAIKEMETALRVVLNEILEEKFGERLDTIGTDVKGIRETLYGNGKEGVVEIVRRHDRFISGFMQIGMAVLIAVAVAAVIGLTVLLVKFGQLGQPLPDVSWMLRSLTCLI